MKYKPVSEFYREDKKKGYGTQGMDMGTGDKKDLGFSTVAPCP
jgi:hypothetical protein